MYKQSNEAKLAYQSAERTLDIVVNVNGVDYKATDIEQFDYDSGGYTGDTFSIGSTYENNITVKFIHLVEGLKRGMIVKPRIGIKLPSGTFEYTPLGVFIIADEIQMDRNNNSTTIKAYDKFVVMEGQYVSKLTYPANAVDIITEIAQMCKVDVNTNDLAHLPTIKVSKAITKQSYRTAIGWIAQLYVGFASFDRDGKLTIRRVAEPNYTIEPSEYEQQGLVKNEAPYIIGGISCNVNVVETTNNGETNETTHKIHSGSVNGSQIELTNDIMTQELLDSIWNSLKTVTFYPFSLNWFGNPAIEAGDWLSLKDMKGNVFIVPNNGYTISFNGGLSSTSKADQNATDSSTVKYTGELTRAIENYSRRQAPDGTNIYTDVKEPTDAKFNDVWFKPNGNSTELWIFERQSDGTGKWVKQPVNGEVEQKINDALKDFDELDKSFKDNANTQSATNELMKSRIDSISNQIPNLNDEISRVNGNVTSLKTQTDKDRQQLQSTSQNLDKTRQDLLSNSNRIDKLSIQTDKDRQQLQTTSQNLDKARQDVLSNSSRIDKLSVGLDSVNINVNNINSKVDGIQIGGGKNLVRGTSGDWTGVGRDEFNGSNNQTHIIGLAYLDQLKVGDSVTVTCNYQYSGVTNSNAEAQIQGWGNVDGWGSGQFPRQTPFAMQTGNDLYKGSINYTFKLTADMVKNRYWQLAWRFNYVNQGAWFQWVFFKMEKGTTATPWTPAPEDEIERVAQLKVDLNGINATVATNKGDIAQIKLTENGMQQSIKDAQGNISTLQNDSKQFKQQFQDVNGNITTIKNDAKSLSSQLSTKVGTSEYNSFKEQTAQQLQTKLTASDLSGYAKSADVKVSVDGLNARFDNLSVGGTNLLRKTSNEWKTWTGTGWANDVVDAGSINLDAGTYTFRVEIDNTGNTQQRVHAEAYVFSESRFLDQIAKSYTQTFVNARSKGYATITFTIDKPLTDVRIHPHAAADSPITSTVTIKWRREKLEKGTIATDWSPAPEDEIERVAQLRVDLNGINATVATNKGDIAQIKLTENGMQQSIKDAQGNISTLQNDSKQFKQQFQDVNGNITTIKNDAKSLSSQLSTKVGTSEYNSFKEQTAQQLQTKLTASDLSGYAKSADVKVSVDGLNARFDSLNVGGTNLLYKTKDIDINNKNWYQKGGNVYYDKRYDKKAIHAWGDWSTYVSNQTVHLESNTDYTVSAYLMSYQKGTGNGIQFGVYAKNTADNQEFTIGFLQNTKGNLSNTEWRRFSTVYHNTTAKDITDFRIEASGDWSTVSGNVWIAEIKLETGNIATDYTQAPEDTENELQVLSGKITANSNEFSTVYTKITNAKNDAINAIKGDSQWQSMGKIVTNASFLQNSDGFAQEVVRTATPMVNGGSKNLARGTSDSWTGVSKQEFNGGTNFTKNVADVYLDDLSVGDRVSVQIIYQYSGVTSNNAQCWLQGPGDVTGWNGGNFYGTPSVINMQTGTDVKHGSAKYTFDITADMKKNRFWRVAYRFDNVNKGAWFQWLRFKVEKGTVATPWSPAPEDLATKLQLNQVIDTADSHTRTISDYLTGSNSRFVQMANYLNMNVGSSSVSVNGDGVMLSGNRIKITGKTLIDNAVILDALIKDINANTIKTKKLDASKINVTNLNANNITSGTISGANLNINLDSGNVSFQKGRIHSSNDYIDINIDQQYISTADNLGRLLFKGSSLQIAGSNIFDNSDDYYLKISNGLVGGSYRGANIVGRDYIAIANKANYLGDYLTMRIDFSGLAAGKSNTGWQPTLVGGADRGVLIAGGNVFSSNYSIGSSPFIAVGTNNDGPSTLGAREWYGKNIVINGEYTYIPSSYNKTTSSASNVFVDSNGILMRSTSASKYKSDISRTHDMDYGNKLLELPVATWIDKAEFERYARKESEQPPIRHFGMIAEDLADVGLEMLVTRNESGELEGIQYDRIAPALIPVIADLKRRLENLERKQQTNE